MKILIEWFLIEVFYPDPGGQIEGAGLWADEVSHHLGITFQEKVSKGASHLEKAGFCTGEECVPSAEIKGSRRGFGMKD